MYPGVVPPGTRGGVVQYPTHPGWQYIMVRSAPLMRRTSRRCPRENNNNNIILYPWAYGSRKVDTFFGWVPPHPKKPSTFPLPTPCGYNIILLLLFSRGHLPRSSSYLIAHLRYPFSAATASQLPSKLGSTSSKLEVSQASLLSGGGSRVEEVFARPGAE